MAATHARGLSQTDDLSSPASSPSTPLRHLASLPKFRSMPGVETVPAMVGMCVGWAFGDGCVQLLAELRRDHPSWCEPALYEGGPPDCHTANLLASVLLTLVAAVLIVGIQPWSKNVELYRLREVNGR